MAGKRVKMAGKTVKRLTLSLLALPESAERILIVKAGKTVAEWNDGSSAEFFMDRAGFDAIMEHVERRGVEIVFDYEHQTASPDRKPKDGLAKAAGWIKPTALEWVEGEGMYANVDWNPAAAKMIAEKEYKYYSPVMDIDKETGRPFRLYSVALTNVPAMNDIQPIAASADSEVRQMEKLLERLGLGADATPEQVLEAFDKFIADAVSKAGKPSDDQTAMSAAVMLGFDATIKTKDALVKAVADLKAAKSTAEDARYTAILDRVVKAEKALATQECDALILAATTAGKAVTKPLADSVRFMYMTDPAEAKKLLDALPVTAKPGESGDPEKKSGDEKTRDRIIADSCREFDNTPGPHKAITTKLAFVNLGLRDAKMSPLSKDEAAKL